MPCSRRPSRDDHNNPCEDAKDAKDATLSPARTENGPVPAMMPRPCPPGGWTGPPPARRMDRSLRGRQGGNVKGRVGCAHHPECSSPVCVCVCESVCLCVGVFFFPSSGLRDCERSARCEEHTFRATHPDVVLRNEPSWSAAIRRSPSCDGRIQAVVCSICACHPCGPASCQDLQIIEIKGEQPTAAAGEHQARANM